LPLHLLSLPAAGRLYHAANEASQWFFVEVPLTIEVSAANTSPMGNGRGVHQALGSLQRNLHWRNGCVSGTLDAENKG
jgi:hypothetical protein